MNNNKRYFFKTLEVQELSAQFDALLQPITWLLIGPIDVTFGASALAYG